MLPITDPTNDMLETIAAATILLRNAQRTYEETELPLHLKRKLELERMIDKWIDNLQWSVSELDVIKAVLR